MLFVRQMGIALLALLLVGFVIGPIGAAVQGIAGPFRTPDGLLGTAVQLASIVALFVIVQQVYIRIERWDAMRSGRPPQR